MMRYTLRGKKVIHVDMSGEKIIVLGNEKTKRNDKCVEERKRKTKQVKKQNCTLLSFHKFS